MASVTTCCGCAHSNRSYNRTTLIEVDLLGVRTGSSLAEVLALSFSLETVDLKHENCVTEVGQAKKHQRFAILPQVLQIVLKRFSGNTEIVGKKNAVRKVVTILQKL